MAVANVGSVEDSFTDQIRSIGRIIRRTDGDDVREAPFHGCREQRQRLAVRVEQPVLETICQAEGQLRLDVLKDSDHALAAGLHRTDVEEGIRRHPG